jgi:16S rRNA (guanine(966)-N(2))-methyltransferase RsmD
VATAAAAAAGSSSQQPAPRRQKNAGLYDLDEEAGWGVAVVGEPSSTPNTNAKKNKPKKKAASVAPEAAAALAAMPNATKNKKPAVRMPYVDLSSQAGVAGLEALRQSLAAAEEEVEEDNTAADDQQQRRALLEAARRRNRADQQPRAKLPGMAEAAAAALAEREARRAGGGDDQEDDNDDGDGQALPPYNNAADAHDAEDEDDDHDPSSSVPEFTVTYSGDTGELESFKEKDPRTGQLREARAPWQPGGRRVFVAGDDDDDDDAQQDAKGGGELGAFGEDLLADALGQYGGGAATASSSSSSGNYVNANNSGNVPLALAAWQDVLEEVEMAGGWEQLEALPGGGLATDAPAFKLVPAAPGAVEDFESTMGSAALFREEEEQDLGADSDDDQEDADDDWRGPAAAALRSSSSSKKKTKKSATTQNKSARPATIRQSAPLSGLARPDRRREVGADAAFYAEDGDDDEDDQGRRRSRNLNADEEELDEEGRANGPTVVWGGTGGVTGLDLEEQAAVLARYFQPSEASKLLAQQRAADAEHSELRLKAAGKGGGLGADNERRLHRELRILAGTAANRRILSSKGETTRPMMAKVRGAAFSMIAALSGAGSATALPSTSRWLDLFAGTGSIGIEALSRGAREAHFIEMDPWVAKRVLQRNIASCGFERRSVVHTTKAEDFLRRALGNPRFAGGSFDYVSVCPPYLLVSYPELFDLLEESPLLGDHTVALVEYPKQLAHEVRGTLGRLRRVRDRKYGRTYLALYAGSATPAGAAAAALAEGGDDWSDDDEEEEDEDDEGEERGKGGGGVRADLTGWEI